MERPRHTQWINAKKVREMAAMKELASKIDMSSSKSVQAAEKIREPKPPLPPMVNDWYKDLYYMQYQALDFGAGDFTIEIDFRPYFTTKAAEQRTNREYKIVSFDELARMTGEQLKELDGFIKSWQIENSELVKHFVMGVWP